MGWKRGDLIMKSEPFAHVLSHKHRQERCSYCFQLQESIKKCTGCSVLSYCSRDCQRKDWNLHKLECKSLQRVAPSIPTDSVLLMLRLIIQVVKGQGSKPVEGDPGLRTFDQLMSHMEDIKGDAARCEICSKMFFTLSQLSGPHLQLPDTSQLLDIFGKMVINTFTIADQELQDLGSAVYLSPASLDHCCTPNAVATFRGKTLYIRAIDDIPQGELCKVSESVYLSYVDQLAPSWERQQQLLQQYYFTCQCQRCQHSHLDKLMTGGWSSIPCNEDVTENEGRVEDERVKAAVSACQTTLDKVDALKKSPHLSDLNNDVLKLCRECLAKVKVSLSPTNVYKLRVLDRAFDAAVSVASWEEALDYGVQTLQPYRTLLGSYSAALGLQLLRVGKLQLWLDRLPAAFTHLSQAETIIAVTHGKDSELYSQLKDLLSQTSHLAQSGHHVAAIDTS